MIILDDVGDVLRRVHLQNTGAYTYMLTPEFVIGVSLKEHPHIIVYVMNSYLRRARYGRFYLDSWANFIMTQGQIVYCSK
jgi:hypothetical protein